MSLNQILKKLNSKSGENCISIAIPTTKIGDYEKNRIRWKNAVSELKTDCERNNINCKNIFKKMENLSDDTEFWAHQKFGLAGYFSENEQELIKLNHETISISDVNDTYNLYPLVSELQAHSSIYILSVSKNSTSLHMVHEGNISEIDISNNVVKNYEEAMNFDDDSKSIQHHSVGGGEAYFHGNGAVESSDNVRTMQYLKRVDDGLMEIIRDKNFPLVLACVDEYLPLYKKVTAYNNLSEQIISGNPDHYNSQELLEKSNCILTEELGKNVTSFLNRFNESASSNVVFDTVEDFRTAIKMNNVESVLINEAKLSAMEPDKKNKLTRDVIGAYKQGAKVLCITDQESDCFVLGIKRFKMETTA